MGTAEPGGAGQGGERSAEDAREYARRLRVLPVDQVRPRRTPRPRPAFSPSRVPSMISSRTELEVLPKVSPEPAMGSWVRLIPSARLGQPETGVRLRTVTN